MQDDATSALDAGVRATEAAFSIELSDPALLRRGRATVLRARARGDRGTGDVVAKVFTPAHRGHFLRERAALRALASIPAVREWVPRLIADDDGALALLMDQIPERVSLRRVLDCGDAGDATRVVLAIANRLGALHGQARDAVARFQADQPGAPLPGAVLRAAIPAILGFFTRATGDLPSEAATLGAALAELGERVDEPGPLSTLTLGDMAPGNVVLGPAGPVFVDLEYAGIRSAFYDAMFWRCICPFPSDTADALDRAYHHGLVDGGVVIDDDAFRRQRLLMASHRVFWTLSWNGSSLFDRDHPFVPGVGARSMLRRYLDDYVRLAETSEVSDAAVLVRCARRMTDALARLWPETPPRGELRCFTLVG